jgi:hypothetical protein
VVVVGGGGGSTVRWGERRAELCEAKTVYIPTAHPLSHIAHVHPAARPLHLLAISPIHHILSLRYANPPSAAPCPDARARMSPFFLMIKDEPMNTPDTNANTTPIRLELSSETPAIFGDRIHDHKQHTEQ